METIKPSTDMIPIPKSALSGLEAIRRTGATNMIDRPAVLSLARQWKLNETADWIESVDADTYGRLIVYGPEVVDDEPTLETIEEEKSITYDAIVELGKEASMAITAAYEAEQMGTQMSAEEKLIVNQRRNELAQSLVEASNLWLQLESTLSDIKEYTKSLRSSVYPENH